METSGRPRVLLLGEPSARPAGLERALTRAGFQLVEREDLSADAEADAILITLKNTSEEALSHLLASGRGPQIPARIVVIAEPDPDAPAKKSRRERRSERQQQKQDLKAAQT